MFKITTESDITPIRPELSVATSFEQLKCKRYGWDDVEKKQEQCGALYTQIVCKCHPDHCPECSCEIHGVDIMLPGVLERSSILNFCSSKGQD